MLPTFEPEHHSACAKTVRFFVGESLLLPTALKYYLIFKIFNVILYGKFAQKSVDLTNAHSFLALYHLPFKNTSDINTPKLIKISVNQLFLSCTDIN